jgi:hypothetical protein
MERSKIELETFSYRFFANENQRRRTVRGKNEEK